MIGVLARLRGIFTGISGEARRFLAVVGLCSVCSVLGYCVGVSNERGRADAVRAKADAIARERAADNNDQAAGERVADAIAVAVKNKETRDAIAKAPSGAPDAARVAYGCQRLRQQGRSEASLPAPCRRPGSD